MKKKISIIILSILLFSVSSISFADSYLENSLIYSYYSEQLMPLPKSLIEALPIKEEMLHDSAADSLLITINGDILPHGTLIGTARRYDAQNNIYYDFSDMFERVTPYLNIADLNIANFEASSNPNYPYRGYPQFNSPPDIFKSLKEVGYDFLITANNHAVDTGMEGLISTITHLRDAGLKNTGTFLTPENNRPYIETINNIDLGIINYTFSLNGLEASLTNEQLQHVNMIDEDKIKEELLWLEENSDFSLVLIHWGNEYQLHPSEYQKELAQKMVQWGADAIVGGHPHVIQDSEIIMNGSQPVYVLYSTGNFVSNQRHETLSYDNAYYTEDGVISILNLEKNNEDKVMLKEVKQVPTWVYRFAGSDGYYDYRVIPTTDYVNSKGELFKFDALSEAVKASYDRTTSRIQDYTFEINR